MKEFHRMTDVDLGFTENDAFLIFCFIMNIGVHLRCLSIELSQQEWTYIIHICLTNIVLYAVVNIFMKAWLAPRKSKKSEGTKQQVIKFNDKCKVIIQFSSSDYRQTFLQYTSDIHVQGYPDRYRSGLCVDHERWRLLAEFSTSDYGQI